MESFFRSTSSLILLDSSDLKWKQHMTLISLSHLSFVISVNRLTIYARSRACCPGNIVSPAPPTPLLSPSLPPSPSYVISLPLGPWQTHQTGRKWSALLGRLSGLPPGFMANRQCLSLNRERQRGVGEGGGGVGGREGAEAQSRGTEWFKTSFAYRIVQTDTGHLWKMLTKLWHCEHLEHICRTNQCCRSCLLNLLWQLEANCTFFCYFAKSKCGGININSFDWSTAEGDPVLRFDSCPPSCLHPIFIHQRFSQKLQLKDGALLW